MSTHQSVSLNEGLGSRLPDRAAVVRQLSQVLSNSLFIQSPRMSGFLRFAVEQTLDGRSGQLKEYVIGVEVFGLRASYSPQEDPVVRISAGRLRGKLAEYYQTSGQSDAVRIELPKGGYVPRFMWRQPLAPEPSDAPASSPGGHPSVGRDKQLNRLRAAFIPVCSSNGIMVPFRVRQASGRPRSPRIFWRWSNRPLPHRFG